MEFSAQDFAREGIEAWNSHDLHRIRAHYSENCEITTNMTELTKKEPNQTPATRLTIG